MSRLIIEASTPLCLLQDAGRFGVRHLGVTQGGALDWVSMSWANWLLGNALDAPVVEITLGVEIGHGKRQQAVGEDGLQFLWIHYSNTLGDLDDGSKFLSYVIVQLIILSSIPVLKITRTGPP